MIRPREAPLLAKNCLKTQDEELQYCVSALYTSVAFPTLSERCKLEFAVPPTDWIDPQPFGR